MKRILVTGSTGVVGTHVCTELTERGLPVRATLPWICSACGMPNGVELHVVGDLRLQIDWNAALKDVDAEVHLPTSAHLAQPNELQALAAL